MMRDKYVFGALRKAASDVVSTNTRSAIYFSEYKILSMLKNSKHIYRISHCNIVDTINKQNPKSEGVIINGSENYS